jgi:hypothetical protein
MRLPRISAAWAAQRSRTLGRDRLEELPIRASAFIGDALDVAGRRRAAPRRASRAIRVRSIDSCAASTPAWALALSAALRSARSARSELASSSPPACAIARRCRRRTPPGSPPAAPRARRPGRAAVDLFADAGHSRRLLRGGVVLHARRRRSGGADEAADQRVLALGIGLLRPAAGRRRSGCAPGASRPSRRARRWSGFPSGCRSPSRCRPRTRFPPGRRSAGRAGSARGRGSASPARCPRAARRARSRSRPSGCICRPVAGDALEDRAAGHERDRDEGSACIDCSQRFEPRRAAAQVDRRQLVGQSRRSARTAGASSPSGPQARSSRELEADQLGPAAFGGDVGADDRLDPVDRARGDRLAGKARDRDMRAPRPGGEQRPGERMAAGQLARRPQIGEAVAGEDPAVRADRRPRRPAASSSRPSSIECIACDAERHMLRRLQRELDDVAGEEGRGSTLIARRSRSRHRRETMHGSGSSEMIVPWPSRSQLPPTATCVVSPVNGGTGVSIGALPGRSISWSALPVPGSTLIPTVSSSGARSLDQALALALHGPAGASRTSGRSQVSRAGNARPTWIVDAAIASAGVRLPPPSTLRPGPPRRRRGPRPRARRGGRGR